MIDEELLKIKIIKMIGDASYNKVNSKSQKFVDIYCARIDALEEVLELL